MTDPQPHSGRAGASRSRTVDLLAQTHGGSASALAALVEEHLPWIHEHVRRRLGSALRGDAESLDFVQDAMVDALRAGPRFVVSDPVHFRALMARIIENNLRDRRRYMERERRDYRRSQPLSTDSVMPLDPAARSVTGPEDHAARNEDLCWLNLALELLDPEDREVVRLREWEGLGFAALGGQLGVSEEAARKRYARALPKLAVKVEMLRQGRVGGLLDAGEPGQGT